MKSALTENDKRHWEDLNEPYWEMDRQREQNERYHFAQHRAYYQQLRLAEVFEDLFMSRLRYLELTQNKDLMSCRKGRYPPDTPFMEQVGMILMMMCRVIKKAW